MSQCVIVAGGLGSRLSNAGITKPKLLLEIDGRTLLSYIVEEVVREGYTKILFCLGFESEQILLAIRALRAPVQIDVSIEESQLGTLGALEHARSKLDDFFTVIMGDTFLSCSNIGSLHSLCESLSLQAVTLCKFTDHPLDSDLVEINEFGQILRIFRASSHDSLPNVNIGLAGVSFISKELINSEPSLQSRDITRHLFVEAMSSGIVIQALFHQGTIRDLGTPQRLVSFLETQSELALEPFSGFNQTILLDRDGTLNRENGHISVYSDIHIQDSGLQIAERIKTERLNTYLITNQPVIARGKASFGDVLKICSVLLKQLDIWQGDDHIYVCPHYPESGFEGEIVDLKIECTCRKPLPGLLLKAANDHKFRLTNATMIGDSRADVFAGLLVGARVVHLHQNFEGQCSFLTPLEQLLTCIDLEDAATAFAKVGCST